MKRIYLIGEKNGKADETDYVVAYEHMGMIIEIMALCDESYRWYKVDGHEFGYLKDAKAYVERIKEGK